MKTLNSLAMSAALAATMAFVGIPAYAQDDSSYFLIEESELHPNKMGDYKAAWEVVLKHADTHDYKYTTFVSLSGPRVTTATPMTSYSDIDGMMADRDRIYEAGGEEFEEAIANLNAATFTDQTFMVKLMPEISNAPSDEQMETLYMYEIGRAHVQPGSGGKFKKILGKYKEAIKDNGLGDEVLYNVYSGGVGADSSFYFQSFGKNPVDLAQKDAKIDAMFENNEELQELFGHYLSISSPGKYANAENWKMVGKMGHTPD